MIRLEQISKSFAVGDGLTRALSEIYLTIKQGEIFGIIGSSGARQIDAGAAHQPA